MVATPPVPAIHVRAEQHRTCAGGRVVARVFISGTADDAGDTFAGQVTVSLRGPAGAVGEARALVVPDDSGRRFLRIGVHVARGTRRGAYRLAARLAGNPTGGGPDTVRVAGADPRPVRVGRPACRRRPRPARRAGFPRKTIADVVARHCAALKQVIESGAPRG